MRSKKSFWRKGLLCFSIGMSCVLPVSAEDAAKEESNVYVLAPMIVTADRPALPGGFLNATANTGFLGNQDIMETPFNVTNISAQTINAFSSPFNGITDALAVSPSVRVDRGGTYTDVSIRGFYQSGHNFYVNGIPGLLCQENVPFYWVDSVSITAGPNLGVSGSTLSEAVGGTVNFHSKVAGVEGNRSIKFAHRGGSSFEQAIDYGERFGKDKQFGLRVTANNIHGETSIDAEYLKQQNLFINLDQQSKNSKTNLLLGYNHTNHQGAAGGTFTFDKAVTNLPDAPDASRRYKPAWAYNEYDNWIAALNHEQKLSENLSFFVNAGYHREDWYGYIDGGTTVTNNNGDFKVSLSNYPLAFTKKYLGVGFKGNFTMGSVKNDYVVGVDKNWFTYDAGQNPNWSWTGTGNINKINNWQNPGIAHFKAPYARDEQLSGWHIINTASALDDKLKVTLGVHGHKARRTPAKQDQQRTDAICPTFAVSYRFTPEVMAFISHSESFGFGGMVSTTAGYANAGEILDPAKSKQNEIGVRFKTKNFFNTISLFKITQANTIDSYENGNKYLRLDGEQKNKGFEWSTTGNIAKKWDLIGGFMYLDAKDNKGKVVNGAAKWSATLGSIYHATEKLSFLGRMTYLSSSTINSGALDVPSHVKFDLGASYKTSINKTPMKIDFMCYNVADKNYWSARPGYSTVVLGGPRTFVLSATLDI